MAGEEVTGADVAAAEITSDTAKNSGVTIFFINITLRWLRLVFSIFIPDSMGSDNLESSEFGLSQPQLTPQIQHIQRTTQLFEPHYRAFLPATVNLLKKQLNEIELLRTGVCSALR